MHRVPKAPSVGGDDTPRIYRLNGIGIAVMTFSATGALGLGVFLGVVFRQSDEEYLWAARLLFIFIGVCVVWWAMTAKLVLTRDTIQSGRRTLARASIRGRRSRQQLILEPNDGSKALKIDASWFAWDDVLDHWISSLPDLDAQDHDAAVAALLASPQFGESESAREASWREAIVVTRVLNVATVAICVWALFWPVPYPAVTFCLSLLPFVALGLWTLGGGRYAFLERHGDLRPLLSISFLGAILVLMLTVMRRHFGVVDLALLAALGIAAGLALALLLLREAKTWRERLLLVPAMACLFALHVSLTAANANTVLDTQPSQSFRVAVLRVSPNDTSARLAPWGPFRTADNFAVARHVGARLRSGRTARVVLHPGAFGGRWYAIDDWSAHSAPSAGTAGGAALYDDGRCPDDTRR